MVDTTAPTPLTAGPRRSGRAADPSARIRRPAAVGLARLTAGLVGLDRPPGTALPGMAAERIWPDALRHAGWPAAGRRSSSSGRTARRRRPGSSREMLRRAGRAADREPVRGEYATGDRDIARAGLGSARPDRAGRASRPRGRRLRSRRGWRSARSFPNSDRRSSSPRICSGISWIAMARPTRSSTAGRRPRDRR